jgi:two-component system, chemotaxis family, CheB/CheR fusion protein
MGPNGAFGPASRWYATMKTKQASHEKRLKEFLLQRYCPAVLAVDAKHTVVFSNGPVERFINLPTGVPTWIVFDLVQPCLRPRLRSALERVAKNGKTESVAAVVDSDGDTRAMSISISRFAEDSTLLVLAFSDHEEARLDAPDKAGNSAVRGLEAELDQVHDELESRTTRMRTYNEELAAANEELRVANEELETSREELRTTNEQLNAANA